MKKIKFLLIALISIFVFNINVFAASGNLGVSSSNVYVGDNFTVYANISSAAAWNVHVSASGPVSGCSINQADATSDAMDTNKTFSATCTATGEGTITIRLSGDVTSASDGNAVSISGSKSVSVSKKITPPSNNNNNNTNSGTSNNNNTTNNNTTNNNTTNKSNNTNLKELSIEGYKLVKVDANNYTLSVSNDITNVNIKATAEDSKSKVSGTGNHDLKVGDNNIEVIVTSESGTQNKINIKVTRKDGYYLEDLESLLNNKKIDDINITISSDTKISSQDLKKIKSSGKIVKFNYYNNDKSLLYSWLIDGSKIKDTNDFITTISFSSENKKVILSLSNYADGLYISLGQTGNIPDGIKLKLYVGDKFENNDLVNIYNYVKNNDKLNLIKDKLKIVNGYIEFDVKKTSDYFITMSTVPNIEKVVTPSESSSFKFIPLMIIIIVILAIVFIILHILKKKLSKKNLPIDNNTSNYDDITNLTNISTNNYNNPTTNTSTNNYSNPKNNIYTSNPTSTTTNTFTSNYNNQEKNTSTNNYNNYTSQANNESNISNQNNNNNIFK